MQGRDQMGVLVGAEDSESSRVGEPRRLVTLVQIVFVLRKGGENIPGEGR